MDSRYGLNHMDVLADQRGHQVAAHDRPGKPPLERARPGVVFVPPVDVDDDDLGSLSARTSCVGANRAGAREIHRPRMGKGDAVGHLRVGQEGNLDAAHREHRDAPLRRGGTERAGVEDTGPP